MSENIIRSDIKLMRQYYDDALQMQGIPCKYQYPILVESNNQGEPVVDHYSSVINTFIFFDGSPKLKTFKRLGWVVENSDELPMLIHCSFHLQHLQKDSLFEIAGQYSDLPSRKFRVTELTTDLQCPDHVTCQVVPCYDKQVTGKTKLEVTKEFNKSNHFLKPNVDYRGHYRSELKGDR